YWVQRRAGRASACRGGPLPRLPVQLHPWRSVCECAVDEVIRCDADGHTVGPARIQAAYADDAVLPCPAIDFRMGRADSGCADPCLAGTSANLQCVSRSILDPLCAARPGFDAELHKER